LLCEATNEQRIELTMTNTTELSYV